jgi:MoxR-like ATPase
MIETETRPKKDWKIFRGDGSHHAELKDLPPPPPWRFSRRAQPLVPPAGAELAWLEWEKPRAAPFLPSAEMILAVNAALYLRRPLLITGKPGTGKSTLISKVAYELQLGPVLRWPISSRSTVRSGVYEYDAIGRLQSGRTEAPPVEQYLTLGPLGTALMADTWPRPLLIDEIDKSDLDFANDLLNVIEEGVYDIAELRRLGGGPVEVRDVLGEAVTIVDGALRCGQFPFVVMTSNGEREFPPPFLRRCVRLSIEPPSTTQLARIIESQLEHYAHVLNTKELNDLILNFDQHRQENQEVATDQLLNAVFLTIALRDTEERTFDRKEMEQLRESLLRQLSGPAA